MRKPRMAAPIVWNVFLPDNLLTATHSSAYLTGHIDESKSSIYVTGICSTYVNNESEPVIGHFSSSKMQSRIPVALARHAIRLSVSRSSANSVLCRVYPSETDEPCKCVCILFKPTDLISSFVLSEEYETERQTPAEYRSQLSSLLGVYKNKRTSDSTEQAGRNAEEHMSFLESTFDWCLYMLIVVFTVIEWLLRLISFKWCWSRICVQSPAVVSHISYKLNRFKRAQTVTAYKHTSKLVLFDTCGQQLLDSVLGMAFMLYVIESSCADTIATSVMYWADDTANNLNDLLHWLMGAPAGLKLNAQLTEYMGHFFLYHVYLWSGYLSVLRPALGWVIWTAAGFGTLGLSTQLCLIQDIISMLTLHIYCFYVYAARLQDHGSMQEARLYSLQMYTLSSLWRLFRGKKWNVLRLRVDSALYNIDQLCIGTLLFTVLLFLLPTTLLYYFVFTALRLLVLTFHGFLTVVIDSLNIIPVVTIVLRLLKSKSVAGDLLFAVLQGAESSDTDNCVTLSMQTTQLPMLKLCRRARIHMKTEQEQQTYSWSELLKKLVSGNLVYPWVNPYDTDSKEKLL